jgi:AAA domain
VAEGAFGFNGRLDAWEQGWRTEVQDGTFETLPQPVNLTNPLDVLNLGALIDWGGFGFVVIDTLARCMVGADENSAKDCGIVVDALHRLRQRTPGGRGVVTAVHHTGKDGKTFRGSSAFEAGADTVYSVTPDGAVIILDREKRKDGPQLDVHRLKLEPVEGTESMVVGVSRGETNSGRGDKLLSHFQSHFGDRGAYATQLLQASEMSKATFYRALSDLLERGELINDGTDKRPFYKAVTK